MKLPLPADVVRQLNVLQPSFCIGSYKFTSLEWGADPHKEYAQGKHHHEFCEFVFLHQGSIRAIGDAYQEVAEAPACLINIAGEAHQHQQDAPVAMDYWGVSIGRDPDARDDGLTSLVESWLQRRQAVLQDINGLDACIQMAGMEIKSRGHAWQQAVLYHLKFLVFTIIRETVIDIPSEFAEQQSLEQRLRAAIRERIDHDWSVAELAQLCGVGERQLTRQLNNAAACTPMQLLRSERISCAKSLLYEADKTIEAIALHLGYRDKRYFSRIFKEETGHTPSAWRKRSEQYRHEHE